MCYNVQQKASIKELTERFNAQFELPQLYTPQNEIKGFAHPDLTILTSESPSHFCLATWGLIPHWAKDDQIKKNTLNAKLETIAEKPSFRDAQENRCILPVTGFYEWKWLDSKGKRKEKYLIQVKNAPLFALAGLYADWLNPQDGQLIRSFTLLTTKANPVMEEIHNTKKRMPLMMNIAGAKDYLEDGSIVLDEELNTEVIDSDGQLDLFTQ